eukprot:TRINITY_DN8016_c0_g1_i11.p1 TRINITY_DN8016_c0_g1~~TRINITY_DN8016_c0_g1_i11.p1  ORF type:complete len:220 (+),score=13.28 TRINITY_DN8016_c0_g1_i11:294-953(+)
MASNLNDTFASTRFDGADCSAQRKKNASYYNIWIPQCNYSTGQRELIGEAKSIPEIGTPKKKCLPSRVFVYPIIDSLKNKSRALSSSISRSKRLLRTMTSCRARIEQGRPMSKGVFFRFLRTKGSNLMKKPEATLPECIQGRNGFKGSVLKKISYRQQTDIVKQSQTARKLYRMRHANPQRSIFVLRKAKYFLTQANDASIPMRHLYLPIKISSPSTNL